jgi:O-antigen ligase
MWRERPLLGFGPDNFRKLHAGFGGWPSDAAPSRDSAHSAYLEAAASTGTLGLLTLVLTLVAGFARAGRALAAAVRPEQRGAALALLGLLAAIATHATVDFLLSFTAQYVFFGFVIGAASALGGSRDLNAPRAAA